MRKTAAAVVGLAIIMVLTGVVLSMGDRLTDVVATRLTGVNLTVRLTGVSLTGGRLTGVKFTVAARLMAIWANSATVGVSSGIEVSGMGGFYTVEALFRCFVLLCVQDVVTHFI